MQQSPQTSSSSQVPIEKIVKTTKKTVKTKISRPRLTGLEDLDDSTSSNDSRQPASQFRSQKAGLPNVSTPSQKKEITKALTLGSISNTQTTPPLTDFDISPLSKILSQSKATTFAQTAVPASKRKPGQQQVTLSNDFMDALMGGKEPVVAKKPKIIRKKLSPTTAEGHASTSNTTSDTTTSFQNQHESVPPDPSQTKKRVHFADEKGRQLVTTRHFEVDHQERVNVAKMTPEEMKHMEALRERQFLIEHASIGGGERSIIGTKGAAIANLPMPPGVHGNAYSQKPLEVKWRLVNLDDLVELITNGSKSEAKKIELKRQDMTMEAFVHPNIPVTLTDLEESELAKQREECANQKTRLIPLELINEPDSVMAAPEKEIQDNSKPVKTEDDKHEKVELPDLAKSEEQDDELTLGMEPVEEVLKSAEELDAAEIRRMEDEDDSNDEDLKQALLHDLNITPKNESLDPKEKSEGTIGGLGIGGTNSKTSFSQINIKELFNRSDYDLKTLLNKIGNIQHLPSLNEQQSPMDGASVKENFSPTKVPKDPAPTTSGQQQQQQPPIIPLNQTHDAPPPSEVSVHSLPTTSFPNSRPFTLPLNPGVPFPPWMLSRPPPGFPPSGLGPHSGKPPLTSNSHVMGPQTSSSTSSNTTQSSPPVGAIAMTPHFKPSTSFNPILPPPGLLQTAPNLNRNDGPMQIQQGVQTMQVAKNDANEQPPGLESGEITSPSAPTHHPKSFSEANMPQQDIGPPNVKMCSYFVSHGTCKFGMSCRYSHGDELLTSGLRQSMGYRGGGFRGGRGNARGFGMMGYDERRSSSNRGRGRFIPSGGLSPLREPSHRRQRTRRSSRSRSCSRSKSRSSSSTSRSKSSDSHNSKDNRRRGRSRSRSLTYTPSPPPAKGRSGRNSDEDRRTSARYPNSRYNAESGRGGWTQGGRGGYRYGSYKTNSFNWRGGGTSSRGRGRFNPSNNRMSPIRDRRQQRRRSSRSRSRSRTRSRSKSSSSSSSNSTDSHKSKDRRRNNGRAHSRSLTYSPPPSQKRPIDVAEKEKTEA